MSDLRHLLNLTLRYFNDRLLSLGLLTLIRIDRLWRIDLISIKVLLFLLKLLKCEPGISLGRMRRLSWRSIQTLLFNLSLKCLEATSFYLLLVGAFALLCLEMSNLLLRKVWRIDGLCVSAFLIILIWKRRIITVILILVCIITIASLAILGMSSGWYSKQLLLVLVMMSLIE